MSDDDERADNISELMEKLWGPRTEPPPVQIGPPPDEMWGPGGRGSRRKVPLADRSAAPDAPAPVEAPDSPPGFEALRARVDAALAEQLAAIRAELTTAVAGVEGRIAALGEGTSAELARLRSELDASFSQRLEQAGAYLLATIESRLDGMRAEAVEDRRPRPLDPEQVDALLGQMRKDAAVADARFADAERRQEAGTADQEARLEALDSRLSDDIQRVRAEAVTDGRVAAVEAGLREALGRLAEPVEDPGPRPLTPEDVDALRARLREDAVAAADARISGAEIRLVGRLDDIAAGVAQATAVGGRIEAVERRHAARQAATTERFDSLEERLGDELQRLARTVEGLRADAVPEDTGARVTALEAELRDVLARLAEPVDVPGPRPPTPEEIDALRAGLREDAVAATDARLDDTEAQAAERLAALEQRVGAALEGVRSEAVSQADLDAVRADVASQIANLAEAVVPVPTVGPDELASLRSETQADLAAAMAESRDELRSSATSVMARLDGTDEAVARVSASVEAQRAELGALRPELDAAIGERVEQLRRDVEGRLEELPGQAGDVQGGRARRGGRKQQPVLGPADLDRLADTMEGWRIEGNEEVDALRSELSTLSRETGSAETVQAAVAAAEAQFADRLDEMAAWVVREATKAAERVAERAGPAGLVDRELRVLQERVEALSAAVAELQRKPAASRRKPATEPAAPAAPTKRRGTKVLAPRESPSP